MFAPSQKACLLFTTCGNKNEVFLSRDTCLEVENLLKMSTEIGGIIRNPLFFERSFSSFVFNLHMGIFPPKLELCPCVINVPTMSELIQLPGPSEVLRAHQLPSEDPASTDYSVWFLQIIYLSLYLIMILFHPMLLQNFSLIYICVSS